MFNSFKKMYRRIKEKYLTYPSTLSYIAILLEMFVSTIFVYAMVPIVIKYLYSFGILWVFIPNLITYVLSNSYLKFLYSNLFVLLFFYILRLVMGYAVFDNWYFEKAKQVKKDYKTTIELYIIQRCLKDGGSLSNICLYCNSWDSWADII